MRLFSSGFFVGVMFCLVLSARADTNLSMACLDADAANKNTSTAPCLSRSWKKPTATDYVISASSTATGVWGNADAKARRYDSLTSGNVVLSCTRDVPNGTTYDSDACKDAQQWLVSEAGAGRINLTWTAPTTNTDNTALTDLVGYWVYSAASGSPLGKLVKLGAVNSYLVSGLAPGSYSFALSAINAGGKESALTPAITKTIAVAKKVPSAPTGLNATVVESTVYSIKLDYTFPAVALASAVGTVPVGSLCLGATEVSRGYYYVDRTKVRWSGTNRPQYVVAKCG